MEAAPAGRERLDGLVGIGTWCYVDPAAPDFDSVARQLVAEGYDGIELEGDRAHFDHRKYSDANDLTALRRRLASLGLRPSGYNPRLGKAPLKVLGEASRSAYLADASAGLRFAGEVGVRTMRIETGLGPDDVPPAQAADALHELTELWGQLAVIAERCDIRVAWEFEPAFFPNRPSQILQVLDAVGSSHFGVLFDASHAHMIAARGARQSGEPETLPGGEIDFARALSDRVQLVHLIDSDGTLQDGFTSSHVPIGHGDLDLTKLAGVLLETGYRNPWWNIDLCLTPDVLRWSAESRSRAGRILASVARVTSSEAGRAR